MSHQNLGEFLKEYSKKYQGTLAYQIKRGLRTQRFSFEDVYNLALKTALFLKTHGLKKGDRIAIWAPNMPEYPILYFGCWMLGLVVVPIDIRTTEETLKVFLTKAKCKLGFKGKFIPGSFGSLVEESFYLEELASLIQSIRWLQDSSEVSLNDLAEIAFTSGTTGTPKGVMLTHGNFLSDVQALTAAFPFKKDYRTLSLLPLSHAFEQVVDFLALFKSGIKVTYLERTNRLTIIRAMRKGKITSVVLVPQALQLLMGGIEAEVEKQGKQRIWSFLNQIAPMLPIWARRLLFRQVQQKFGGNLQFFGCGSAPLNLKLARKWENLGIEIFEGYGATETTAALAINYPLSKRLGSVGKVLPGMEVRIDPETSEILAEGPNISPGYFEAEEKTQAAFLIEGDKRWYKTGDVGKLDRDGFLHITGREAFRIVLANGQKVYPEDIERVFNAHPLVVESCVVADKREEGEIIHAVVITKYPQKLDQIIKEVNKKLSSHEQILEWSLWKGDDFPRTPILKIDRKKVAEAVIGLESRVESQESMETGDKLLDLIVQVTKKPIQQIKDSASLATDLGLDSLGRVELLSLIEQEYAVAISETKINPQTSVSDLRKLIKQAPSAPEEIPLNGWLYQPWMMRMRRLFQDILVHPLHSLFVPLEVSGKENLKDLKLPVIFYFNHIGIMDGVCVLRILPRQIIEKLVIALDSKLWKDYRRFWVEVFGAGFPFDKKEKVKASLEATGEFLDNGFSILLAPEGDFTKDGKLLKFKPGIGFLATEANVAVVPIKIDPTYLEIFPPMGGKFIENIPKKRKKIWIKIGKPLNFEKDIDFEEAAKIMQEALENL